MKKVGIMQAYFMPYIGYFQLVDAVDEFIIYDNIQYTKKGWINRNRILQGGGSKYITLPLKKDSDFLDICQRSLADSFMPEKLLRQIGAAYRRAPHFEEVMELLNEILFYEDRNLFQYIYYSLRRICLYLGITTPLIVSSSMEYDSSLRGEDKVIAICRERDCGMYINAIGGMGLYRSERFEEAGMELRFISTAFREYRQFGQPFVPALSVIDVMMFNSKEQIRQLLTDYDLLKGN